jgi:hypothetical protein
MLADGCPTLAAPMLLPLCREASAEGAGGEGEGGSRPWGGGGRIAEVCRSVCVALAAEEVRVTALRVHAAGRPEESDAEVSKLRMLRMR